MANLHKQGQTTRQRLRSQGGAVAGFCLDATAEAQLREIVNACQISNSRSEMVRNAIALLHAVTVSGKLPRYLPIEKTYRDQLAKQVKRLRAARKYANKYNAFIVPDRRGRKIAA